MPSSAAFTVRLHAASASPTLAVMTALPAATAVTSPLSLTVATAGSLLLHAQVSSVSSLTFSVSLSPTVSASTARFRVMTFFGSAVSGVVASGAGVTSSTGGFSPPMASLIWSPNTSHTTSSTSRASTSTITGPRMLGARRRDVSSRRLRRFFTRPL